MLNKLILRNARRSMREYVVYLLTLTLIAALMFAFNSMIFSKDILAIYSVAGVMAAMVGVASFFVLIIVIWLIHYMVRFMLEKRSREFGTYLLFGVKKKQILSMFTGENLVLAAAAFLLGIIPGIFIQQILTTIFYSLYGKAYHLSIELNRWTILMTICLYTFAVLFALFCNKKRIKRMKIYDLMYLDKQNEVIKGSNKTGKQWMFFAGLLYILVFHVMIFTGSFTIENIWVFLLAFVAAIYFFYIGLTAFISAYAKKKKKGIYKGAGIFLLRQMSSKIKTMQITMGTISILFMTAILGCSISMMFHDYMDTQLEEELPFDILAISDDTEDDFSKLLGTVRERTDVREAYVYQVYTDKKDRINGYLFQNYEYFANQDYSAEKEKEKMKIQENVYFEYDTYLSLGDYNHLLRMIGRNPIELKDNEYYIQTKKRLASCLEKLPEKLNLSPGGEALKYAGISTRGFSQNGNNGSDYIIIVPDKVTAQMNAYFSLLAVAINTTAPDDLEQELIEEQGLLTEGETVFNSKSLVWGTGTDQIFSFPGTVLVKDNIIKEMKFIVTAITFPMVYIALIFVCVALTILSVQQLGDASKYKFRYQVLSKLGLSEAEVDRIVLKQLLIYYMCPFLAAVGLSTVIALFISERFIYYVGVNTAVYQYYAMAVGIFLLVYLIYFVVTYVEFKRNIHSSRD